MVIAAFIVGGDETCGCVHHQKDRDQSHVSDQAKYLTDLSVHVLSCGYVGAAVSAKGTMTGSKGGARVPQGCEKVARVRGRMRLDIRASCK